MRSRKVRYWLSESCNFLAGPLPMAGRDVSVIKFWSNILGLLIGEAGTSVRRVLRLLRSIANDNESVLNLNDESDFQF